MEDTKFRIAWRKQIHPDQKLKEEDFFAKNRSLALSIDEAEQLNAILVQGIRRLDAYLRDKAQKEMDVADGPKVVDSGIIIPGSETEQRTEGGLVIPFHNPREKDGEDAG